MHRSEIDIWHHHVLVNNRTHQIERPSKEAHEAAMAVIDGEIDAIKATRAGVQAKIDAALGNKRDLNKLKNRKVSSRNSKAHGICTVWL